MERTEIGEKLDKVIVILERIEKFFSLVVGDEEYKVVVDGVDTSDEQAINEYVKKLVDRMDIDIVRA